MVFEDESERNFKREAIYAEGEELPKRVKSRLVRTVNEAPPTGDPPGRPPSAPLAPSSFPGPWHGGELTWGASPASLPRRILEVEACARLRASWHCSLEGGCRKTQAMRFPPMKLNKRVYCDVGQQLYCDVGQLSFSCGRLYF